MTDATAGTGAEPDDLLQRLTAFRTKAEATVVDLQWAYIGLGVSVGGLAVAIATAGPTLGVGAIIGIVLSAIGVIVSLISVIMAFTNSSSRNAGLATALTATPALSWKTSAFAG